MSTPKFHFSVVCNSSVIILAFKQKIGSSFCLYTASLNLFSLLLFKTYNQVFPASAHCRKQNNAGVLILNGKGEASEHHRYHVCIFGFITLDGKFSKRHRFIWFISWLKQNKNAYDFSLVQSSFQLWPLQAMQHLELGCHYTVMQVVFKPHVAVVIICYQNFSTSPMKVI